MTNRDSFAWLLAWVLLLLVTWAGLREGNMSTTTVRCPPEKEEVEKGPWEKENKERTTPLITSTYTCGKFTDLQAQRAHEIPVWMPATSKVNLFPIPMDGLIMRRWGNKPYKLTEYRPCSKACLVEEEEEKEEEEERGKWKKDQEEGGAQERR